MLLAEAPFKHWSFEKSFDTDLEELLINYVFGEDGMDFVCDAEDKVQTIFLYADDSRCFVEGVDDLPFTFGRREVIARLGSPAKSGGRVSHPILGESGPWDRFARSGYAIHVQYRPGADVINLITIMRADVVP
jgi:hypothetical protein